MAIAAPQYDNRRQQQYREPQQQYRPNVYRDPQQQINQGQRGPPIQILRFENENNGDGTYHYNYETENGITAHESGYLRNRGSDNEINTVEGAYQYYDPEGQLVK